MPYCTDNSVNWVVVQKAFEMPPNQYEFFRKMFYEELQKDGNWRTTQRNVNTLGFYDYSKQ